MSKFVFGKSAVMKRIRQAMAKIARSGLPIFLQGETGTGKSLLAREIHKLSSRASGKFVAFDCAALPRTLVESELFGHEKGAFTNATDGRRGLLEEASNGTLFLDEIENLDLQLQTKFLGVLEEKKIRRIGGNRDVLLDFRLISASNDHVAQKVREGDFRQDLFYRIKGTEIYIPPLRERKEDIVPLAEHFLSSYNREHHCTKTFSNEVKACLESYGWLGNVRELKFAVEEAAVISPGKEIQVENFSLEKQKDFLLTNGAKTHLRLDELEKHYIELILRSVDFNKSRAAQLLGIGLNTLYRKIERYRIDTNNEKGNMPKWGKLIIPY